MGRLADTRLDPRLRRGGAKARATPYRVSDHHALRSGAKEVRLDAPEAIRERLRFTYGRNPCCRIAPDSLRAVWSPESALWLDLARWHTAEQE